MAENVLDPDGYDINEAGIPIKVTQQEYVERKRAKLRDQIKYHQIMVHVLTEQLEQTTTIQL